MPFEMKPSFLEAEGTSVGHRFDPATGTRSCLDTINPSVAFSLRAAETRVNGDEPEATHSILMCVKGEKKQVGRDDGKNCWLLVSCFLLNHLPEGHTARKDHHNDDS